MLYLISNCAIIHRHNNLFTFRYLDRLKWPVFTISEITAVSLTRPIELITVLEAFQIIFGMNWLGSDLAFNYL